MARTQRQIKYIAVVKAGYECKPESTGRHTVTFVTMVCYAEVLFQSRFSLCRSARCLRNMRLPTRWLGSGLRNGAHRASQNVTVHSLSAYSQDLLFTAHLYDSHLYQAKEAKTCCAHHPCIDRPILCCPLSQCTHNPSWITLGLHFAHKKAKDENNQRRKRKKRPPKGNTPETFQKTFETTCYKKSQQLRSKKKPWTLKVALCFSGVSLVTLIIISGLCVFGLCG